MPFVSRYTETPPLASIQELEQIIIVDKTGPVIPLGVSQGATCLVGEFLKGPFYPFEVFSAGDIINTFGACSSLLSQSAPCGDQTAGNLWYNGNGVAELKGKTFKRLVLQRVDMDVRKTTAPTEKAYIQFIVTVAASEQASNLTTVDILIPAGTRFANDASTPTVCVALSQDIVIPKGTAIVANEVTISTAVSGGPMDLVPDATTGQLRLAINAAGAKTGGSSGATAFFVYGNASTAAPHATSIDAVLDSAIPGYASTIKATGIAMVDSGAVACGLVPPNAAASLQESIVANYTYAIAKTLPGVYDVCADITTIWSARNDIAAATYTIRDLLWNNAIDASAMGRGRVACISNTPALANDSTGATNSKTAAKAIQAHYTGVNADRVMINFPYAKVYSSELAKNIPVSPAGFKASLFSNLPEEWESGVANEYLANIQSFEDCWTANGLSRADYVAFKAAGVSALLKDKTVGWWFQSSVTGAAAATYPTRVKDNRRRMADFIQDTLAGIAAVYNKKPGTTERVDALVGEIDTFLSGLVSASNPAQQRIAGYYLDAKSANTTQLTGLGIWTFIVKVQMLGDLDQIVFQAEIGPTVDIEQVA